MSNRVTGLDHVDIVVGDPDAMADFLCRAGFSLHRRTEGGRGSVELRFPGSDIILELTPSARPDGSRLALGLRHLALRCADLDAAISDLRGVGLEFPEPPRWIAATGRRVANAIDPDGRVLQFTE